MTHHWLIVERKPLHGPQSVRRALDFFKYDKGLAPHFERFQCYDIDNLAELRKNGVKGLLQLLFLDFFVQIVDVYRVVWSDIHLKAIEVRLVVEE